jgi:hypothetical protein
MAAAAAAAAGTPGNAPNARHQQDQKDRIRIQDYPLIIGRGGSGVWVPRNKRNAELVRR